VTLSLLLCACTSEVRPVPTAPRPDTPVPGAAPARAPEAAPPTLVATVAPVARATPTSLATRAPTPAATAAAEAEASAEATQVPSLDGLLNGLLPDGSPAYGLVLEDLSTGARTAVNDDQPFPSASLYKLGVAWLALREVDAGTLSLDATLPIEDDDTVEPEPRGGYGSGDTPTVREALGVMLSVSSNAAAHAFLRVLGRASVNHEMDRLGLTQTRVPDDDETEAVTSAGDIARLLRLISTSPELSVTAKEVLAQGMANISPPDALRDSLPETVGILDKTGNLPDSSNVGALLESSRATVIVVVVDSGVNPGEARAIIAQLGQIAYHSLLE
jgi:beta-lactamase class A